jgi:penicillin-insensitive murein endopeptidase
MAGILAVSSSGVYAATPAKKLFGAKRLPTILKPASYGFYSKGCLAGGIAIAHDGPNWQAMRPQRNRRWGHPKLIRLLERLSIDAKKIGWNGLMIGDLSQPRGGPMLTGHASHQVGLDADIWMRPMPKRRWTREERQKTSAISVLRKGSVYVDDRIWTKAHEGVLKIAAKYREVQRIFVHPGIKKKLCDTVNGDRSWLHKIRPYWGHHYHFHVRIRCQPGSPGCKSQSEPSLDTGCGKPLDWWFKVAFAPKKKVKKKRIAKKRKKKVRRYAIMADLPKACQTVLNGPAPASLASVTYKSGSAMLAASKPPIPENASAIVASTGESPAERAARILAKKIIPAAYIPIPKARPKR